VKISVFILKQKWFYPNIRIKSFKIKQINQGNPENHLNLDINLFWLEYFPQKNAFS
jgi:hypothetical protein